MKNLIPLRFLLLMFLSIAIVACDDDDDEPANPIEPTPTGRSVTYDLNELAVEDISGTAKFIELSDNSTTVEINLENTPDGGQHPAHIHFNTAAEGGGIAITLGTVDGSTGMSTINFNQLNDGTAITYEDLLDYDGYINVHLSADELGTIVAQGDIGQNALTGESPNELLRLYRMKKAAALIRSGNNNITGIMYEVGFRSTSHFANTFKKFFGQNPSEYRDTLRQQ